MRASEICEVFWETVQSFVETYSELITTFQENLMSEKGEGYAKEINEGRASLNSCLGFKDCNYIKLRRPRGYNVNQRSVYSGHKRMNYLTYQTVKNPDGLIFSLHGPEFGRRHDHKFFRQRGLR